MTTTHARVRFRALVTFTLFATSACQPADDRLEPRSLEYATTGASWESESTGSEAAPGELACVYQKTTGSMIWLTHRLATQDTLSKGAGSYKDGFYYFNDVWCEVTEPKQECPEGQEVDIACGGKLSNHVYLTEEASIKCPMSQMDFETSYATEAFKKEWTIKMLIDRGHTKAKAEEDWPKVTNSGRVFAFYCATKINEEQANLTSMATSCKNDPVVKKDSTSQTYTCRPKSEPSTESDSDDGSWAESGSWGDAG